MVHDAGHQADRGRAARLTRIVLAALAALIVGVWSAGSAFAQANADADGPLDDGAVLVEADEVLYDPETDTYRALGAVEARYGTRVIRAEEVIYEPEFARVTARGGVTIIEDDGTVSFADEAEFSDDLGQGVVTDFAARLANGGRTGAAFVLRRPDGSNELNDGYYTACRPCTEAGRNDSPTWRLTARRVIQDSEDQMIYYRDAVMRIKGVPVFYTPFFAHADPTSERRSGLLLPFFGESTRTGSFYEQPVYWVISPSQDITIAPRIMSDANALILAEHRKRFFSGATVFTGSLTDESEFDDDGEKFGEEKIRGHIFGEGLFRITPEWTWGFGIEHVTDDLYFQRYDIDDADKNRGLYSRGTKRLLSHAYFARETRRSYGSIAGLLFQGLRAEDEDDELPIVGPLVDFRQSFSVGEAAGRIDARFNAVALQRLDGIDSRRATLQGEWSRRTTFSNGVVATPFAFLRGDVYSVGDFVTDDGEIVNDDVFGRALGYAGAEASYPLGRAVPGGTLILEPVVNAIYAPEGGDDDRIPNQDSTTFDLDEASLFVGNRSPGFDLFEDGARATIGGRASWRFDQGAQASVFLGQSYRTGDEGLFSAQTGLDGDTSDVVGSAQFALNRSNAVSARFRLADEDWDIQRLEVDAVSAVGRLRLGARYLRFDQALASGRPSEEAEVNAGVELTRNWGVYYNALRDLDADENRRSFLGLVYRDECTRLELVYKQEETRDRSIGSGESISLQFTLNTLGSFGDNF